MSERTVRLTTTVECTSIPGSKGGSAKYQLGCSGRPNSLQLEVELAFDEREAQATVDQLAEQGIRAKEMEPPPSLPRVDENRDRIVTLEQRCRRSEERADRADAVAQRTIEDLGTNKRRLEDWLAKGTKRIAVLEAELSQTHSTLPGP